VGFMADKVALREDLLRIPRCQYHFTNISYSLIHVLAWQLMAYFNNTVEQKI
jgi:hypothetical protein